MVSEWANKLPILRVLVLKHKKMLSENPTCDFSDGILFKLKSIADARAASFDAGFDFTVKFVVAAAGKTALAAAEQAGKEDKGGDAFHDVCLFPCGWK